MREKSQDGGDRAKDRRKRGKRRTKVYCGVLPKGNWRKVYIKKSQREESMTSKKSVRKGGVAGGGGKGGSSCNCQTIDDVLKRDKTTLSTGGGQVTRKLEKKEKQKKNQDPTIHQK